MQDDPHYVREAFAAGASGYVLKEAADTELVAAVREVADGGRYVHPALGARMSHRRGRRAQARRGADPLSDREREVLRLLALGHTNQEIASMLYISVRTAETHRAHIMQKLRLRPARDSSATRSTKDRSRRRTSSCELRRGADDQHGPLRLPEEPARDAPERGPGDCTAAARTPATTRSTSCWQIASITASWT